MRATAMRRCHRFANTMNSTYVRRATSAASQNRAPAVLRCATTGCATITATTMASRIRFFRAGRTRGIIPAREPGAAPASALRELQGRRLRAGQGVAGRHGAVEHPEEHGQDDDRGEEARAHSNGEQEPEAEDALVVRHHQA